MVIKIQAELAVKSERACYRRRNLIKLKYFKMKTFSSILALLVTLFFSSVSAQTKAGLQKETVKVYGNCEMCQSKIEKAAKSAGAATASWDVDSKVLAVSYNASKSSVAKIEKAVAAAGYDTEHEATTENAYDKLPGCCKYDRKSTDSKSEKKD
jgi:hypothetical protein